MGSLALRFQTHQDYEGAVRALLRGTTEEANKALSFVRDLLGTLATDMANEDASTNLVG